MKYIFLLCLFLLTACGKDSGFVPVAPGDNCEPKAVAEAGGDQYLELGNTDVAQLGSDKFPSGLKFKWDGPEGLDSYDSSNPYFYAKVPGDFLFTLTVTSDKCGGKAIDYAMIHVLAEPKKGNAETIRSRDRFGKLQTYFLGYRPTLLKNKTPVVHMGTGVFGIKKGFPDEMNLRPPQFHVNRQPNGSCWAEGCRSAAEATYFYVTKVWEWLSAQNVINCSGDGSAAGGGQISTGWLVKFGLVREKDDPYNGYDHRCDKNIQPFFKAKRDFHVGDKNGNDPQWPDLVQAMNEFGAGEICGSASSLGNGGWVSNPGTGGTNHCYSTFGYAPGEKYGKPAGPYLRVMNSWGGEGKDEWGIKGEGYYRIAPDGVKIRSSVMTENKFIDMGSPCPPPVIEGGEKTIRQVPGTPQFVMIGKPATVGQTYLWDNGSMLKNPKSVNDAQVLAQPPHTLDFKVTTKNSCAEAHAIWTVHVVEDIGGHLFEMTATGPREIKNASW